MPVRTNTSARAIDQGQIELVAAARAGVPLSVLVKRFELDEVRLKQLNEEFQSVPDGILLGIRRILKDNLGLKKIIADLIAKSDLDLASPDVADLTRDE